LGFSQGLNNLTTSVKTSAQNTSAMVVMFCLRLLTGLILGYIAGLVFQEILQSGNLVVLSFVVVMTFAFMKVSKEWSFMKLLMFDLVTALVLQILRMYILLAP